MYKQKSTVSNADRAASSAKWAPRNEGLRIFDVARSPIDMPKGRKKRGLMRLGDSLRWPNRLKKSSRFSGRDVSAIPSFSGFQGAIAEEDAWRNRRGSRGDFSTRQLFPGGLRRSAAIGLG